MTKEEAIAILENEKECVNRANKNDYCNRDCYNCELVKTDTEILTALDMAISALSENDVLDKIRAKIEHMTITEGGEDYVRKMAADFESWNDEDHMKYQDTRSK